MLIRKWISRAWLNQCASRTKTFTSRREQQTETKNWWENIKQKGIELAKVSNNGSLEHFNDGMDTPSEDNANKKKTNTK